MIVRLVIRTLVWFGMIGVVLFAVAGTWQWPAVWSFLLFMILLGLGGGLWLILSDPALFEERMRPMVQQGQPAADRVFIVAFFTVALVWLIVAGLDQRFGLSQMTIGVQVAGTALALTGMAISFWVLHENSFAAPVIKLQRDRGQHVIDTGPYHLVRHPMYSGAILFFLGTSLWLGSWWSAALTLIMAVLFAWRTTAEERTLRDGLPGYTDYTTRVRYRLCPGLW
ncbi:isoprenylcysteine carboxylmethyltransferase family protein [Tardiphaga sp. P9-11]|jgi:protein-S-isoprenylcysteine O-methyltransferase Ste14|uniref:methyltransferase family protein n=1 Tax=Tardiphaga sp. P9-11 TaxID=2024614 RepID=UPI0011F388E3|nr:isoprenylcysteine carboxylmethyltransferase family protein [Tardiphaga sp. P9-11]KAA0076698.1 isoprenylcysteine carboxylmethyltransferase family protein [Tardiphaga sp. P9-11]